MKRDLLGTLAFLQGVCKGWTEGTPVTGPPQKLPAPRLSQASQETPDPQGHHWLLEELSESCVWVCPPLSGPVLHVPAEHSLDGGTNIHPPTRPSKLSSVGRQDDHQEQGDLPQGCCPPSPPPRDLGSEECLFLKSGKSLNKRGSFSFSRAGRKSEVDKNHRHWWLTSLWGLLLTG